MARLIHTQNIEQTLTADIQMIPEQLDRPSVNVCPFRNHPACDEERK